jgi:electron transfer flavoprotein alpha subunit
MSILIICDFTQEWMHKNHLKTIAAAQQLCQPITCLVLANDFDSGPSLPAYSWLLNVFYMKSSNSPMQCMLSMLQSMQGHHFTTIMAADSTLTKQILPTLAAHFDVDMVSGVIEILDDHTYKRAIFAGEWIATVKNNATIQVISLRASAFEAMPTVDSPQPIQAEMITLQDTHDPINFEVAHTLKKTQDLTTAPLVIAGGRGLGDAKHFELIEILAKQLGAAVGATRAAVDAGWVDNALQIGQTGKIIAPQLYIAVGISGAIQHLAGIKGSKHIIAINQDPDAPIMRWADYIFEADLLEVLPLLNQKFESEKF